MTDNLIDRIRADADRATSEIARHQAEIVRLDAELEELKVTLRTLGRLGVLEEHVPNPPMGPKPTVPEMIREVLGRPDNMNGAEPAIVLSAIRESYDRDIDPNNVRPTMWRMAKDGRLVKRGDVYMLPPQVVPVPDHPFAEDQ